MRRRGWVRAAVVGLVPLALAFGCGKSGFRVDDEGATVTDGATPLVAELYPSCSSRYALDVDRAAGSGAITPEGALTAFLATSAGQSLSGILFEPARAPRSYQPVQSVPAGPTSSSPATTPGTTLPSPQWFARHDQRGRVTAVVRVDDAGDGWAVSGVYGCTPGRESDGSTGTTFAFYPSGSTGSP